MSSPTKTEAVADVAAFTDREAGLLAEAERAIERGRSRAAAGLAEMGEGLKAIRDGRLYRADGLTWADYCTDRWGMSSRHADRLVRFTEVQSITGPIGLVIHNEGQARELAAFLDDPDELREVAREAHARSNGRPTAAVIREVAEEREPKPTPDVPADVPPSPPPGDGTPRVVPDAPPLAQGGEHSPAVGRDAPAAGEPERPRPPKWDPAERAAHEEEVRRLDDIRSAQQQAKTLVPDVRALIFTVLQGSRQDKDALRGLITRDMIADLRKAVDLLEGEIDDEE